MYSVNKKKILMILKRNFDQIQLLGAQSFFWCNPHTHCYARVSAQRAEWLFLLVFMFFSVYASNAFAEAPDIQGNVVLDVSASEIVNVAIGTNSIAQVVAGSILEGDVIGSVRSVVSVDTISNAAQAANSCSQVILGSIGVANCMGE
jgi:hypothetical protein